MTPFLSRLALIKIPVWIVLLIYGLSLWGVVFLYIYVQNSMILNVTYDFTLPTIKGQFIELKDGSQPSFQDESYFGSVKELFIQNENNFVSVDLMAMRVEAYKKGKMLFEFPLEAKGKKGTWTETPAGLYSVESKTKNHHSSLYNVNMPYSIQFFGNYFIHGWPHHPDGTLVSSLSSAGCIRMETENAKILYDFVKTGMPILVFEENYERDDFAYFDSFGDITAEKYIAIDIQSDFIFSGKEIRENIQMEGLEKLLIGLTAGERSFIGSTITTTQHALERETIVPRFSLDEENTLFTLLSALLVESSEEAMYAIKTHLGESKTLSNINRQASVLGMLSTEVKSFSDHSQNKTTIRDTVSLSKYLYFNRSSLLDITSGKFLSAYMNPKHNNITPIHALGKIPSFAGGFIPYDKDEKASIGLAIFEIKVRNEIRPVAIIVADSEDPEKDILTLFNSVNLQSN